jgi:hypothetical protein
VDGLELLAQKELALALLDALLDLAAQLVAELEQFDLALEQRQHAVVFRAQAVDLQNLQALLDVQPQARGDQVHKPPWAVLVHRAVDQLVGQEWRNGDQASEGFERVARQRLDLGRRRLLSLRDTRHARQQIRLGVEKADHANTLQALHPDLLRAIG